MLLWIILAGSALIRLATAIFNYGFLALDDYYILSTIVPAQLAPDLSCQIELADIRSPIPYLAVFGTTHLAYLLGLNDPLNQIRALYILLGLFSLVSIVYAVRIFQLLDRPRTALLAAGILGFHFLMPYISTRSLLENMGAPFLVASVYYLMRYREKGTAVDLVVSVTLLAFSSMLRFQNGIIFPVFIYVIAERKNLKDPVILMVTGVILLILTGLPDLFLRGHWHESLFRYVKYNLTHSSEYGTDPFYNYLPTVLGIILFPFLISKYPGFRWKKEYHGLLPVVASFFLFLLAHSAIPHKEERFLIPVLPLLLISVAPPVEWLFFEIRSRIRMTAILITNLVLLFFASFTISQYNSIGLVRMLNNHREIRKIYLFQGTMSHVPISYGYRPDLVLEVTPPGSPLLSRTPEDCPFTAAIREDLKPLVEPSLKGLVPLEKFPPSPVEKLLILGNPSSNKRRNTILLYGPPDLVSRKGTCLPPAPEPTREEITNERRAPYAEESALPRKIQGSRCGLEFFGIYK